MEIRTYVIYVRTSTRERGKSAKTPPPPKNTTNAKQASKRRNSNLVGENRRNTHTYMDYIQRKFKLSRIPVKTCPPPERQRLRAKRRHLLYIAIPTSRTRRAPRTNRRRRSKVMSSLLRSTSRIIG